MSAISTYAQIIVTVYVVFEISYLLGELKKARARNVLLVAENKKLREDLAIIQAKMNFPEVQLALLNRAFALKAAVREAGKTYAGAAKSFVAGVRK